MRTGIQKDWASTWFGGKKYIPYLKDDLIVRDYLDKKLKGMGVSCDLGDGDERSVIKEIEHLNPFLFLLVGFYLGEMYMSRPCQGFERMKPGFSVPVNRKNSPRWSGDSHVDRMVRPSIFRRQDRLEWNGRG